MSSYVADIAEAVKDALNAADPLFSGAPEFTAERVYVPMKDYTAVEDTTVQVFHVASERSQETRATVRSDVQVNVLFLHRLDQTTDPTAEAANDTLDELMEWGEAAADVITPGGTFGPGLCLRVVWEPMLDIELLRTHRVFAGVLQCFFMRSP